MPGAGRRRLTATTATPARAAAPIRPSPVPPEAVCCGNQPYDRRSRATTGPAGHLVGRADHEGLVHGQPVRHPARTTSADGLGVHRRRSPRTWPATPASRPRCASTSIRHDGSRCGQRRPQPARPGRAARVHRELRQGRTRSPPEPAARAGSTSVRVHLQAVRRGRARYPARGNDPARRRGRVACARASAPPRRSPSCRSRSRRARSTACSGPTARARRRRCGSWRASCAPTRGASRVAGLDVARDPLAVRQRLGFLTNTTGLYPRLTGRELLDYFARLHGLDRDAAAARIDDAGARAGSGAVSSSGAARRCRPASASGCRSPARCCTIPPCWCSTSRPAGLDVLASRFLRDFVRAERDRGKAVVFSTHYLAEAELLCDRIGLLHRGRLLAEGTPAALRAAAGDAPSLEEAFLRLVGASTGRSRADAPPPMKLAEVLLVAGKELRETLRDRRTLAVMVLFPLVVYPLVSLATVQVMAARIGRAEKVPARVAVAGPAARSPTSCARASRRAPTTAARTSRCRSAGAGHRRRRPRRPRRRRGRGRSAGQAAPPARRRACCSTRRRSARAPRATRIEEALAAGCRAGLRAALRASPSRGWRRAPRWAATCCRRSCR